MAILRKDLPELQKGTDALTQLIVGNKQKQDQAQQEKDLSVMKAGEMLPIQKQQEQDKSDIGVGAKDQEQKNAVETLRNIQDSGMMNDGGGASVNGVNVSRGYDPNKMARATTAAQKKDMQDLDKSPANKALVDTQGQLSTAKYMHDLLDNPNKMDQGTFAALKAQSALGGSGSRAIGQVMHAIGSDDTALAGDYEGFKNKIMGTANTTRTPEQINAARDSVFKFQDEAENKYNLASAQLKAQAPRYAPNLMANGTLDSELSARTAPHQALLNELHQRRQAFAKQAGGESTLQGGSQFKQPSGPGDKLAALLGMGGQKAAAPAPAGKPAQVKQGGHTYNLNPQTGNYE